MLRAALKSVARFRRPVTFATRISPRDRTKQATANSRAVLPVGDESVSGLSSNDGAGEWQCLALEQFGSVSLSG